MGWPFIGKDGLIEKVYLPAFRYSMDVEQTVKGLLTGRVSNIAFLSAYKDLPPIESLPFKDRKALLLEVRRLFPDIETIDCRVKARILYTLGTLL